jgi:hypothetical protein
LQSLTTLERTCDLEVVPQRIELTESKELETFQKLQVTATWAVPELLRRRGDACGPSSLVIRRAFADCQDTTTTHATENIWDIERPER